MDDGICPSCLHASSRRLAAAVPATQRRWHGMAWADGRARMACDGVGVSVGVGRYIEHHHHHHCISWVLPPQLTDSHAPGGERPAKSREHAARTPHPPSRLTQSSPMKSSPLAALWQAAGGRRQTAIPSLIYLPTTYYLLPTYPPTPITLPRHPPVWGTRYAPSTRPPPCPPCPARRNSSATRLCLQKSKLHHAAPLVLVLAIGIHCSTSAPLPAHTPSTMSDREFGGNDDLSLPKGAPVHSRRGPPAAPALALMLTVPQRPSRRLSRTFWPPSLA